MTALIDEWSVGGSMAEPVTGWTVGFDTNLWHQKIIDKQRILLSVSLNRK